MNLKILLIQFFIFTLIIINVNAVDLYSFNNNIYLAIKDSSKINSSRIVLTRREIIKNNITVLRNFNNTIPLQELDKNKIASLSLSTGVITSFTDVLKRYTHVENFNISSYNKHKELNNLLKKLEKFDIIIIIFNKVKDYNSSILKAIIENNKTIVVFNGNLSQLNKIPTIDKADALIVSASETLLANNLSAQLVFGAFTSTGKLPMAISDKFKEGNGLIVEKNKSFYYTVPQEAGIDSLKLETTIDSIVSCALLDSVFPGCQIVIAKDAKVIFHKCYGYHTFEKKQKVSPHDIYDWASITKTTAPLPALMKLVDEEKINLDARFSNYYEKFRESNKKNIIFREVLAHQAQLIPYISFWEMAIDTDSCLSNKVFRHKYSWRYNIRVSDDIYMNKKFRKIMIDTIVKSKLLPEKKYKYSGISFLLYPEIISKLTNTDYEKYLNQTFYKPLGANTVTFNAYKYFDKSRIIPTEYDTYFRHQLIQGFVHDESAAMMEGVSGNAGLFGSAIDLAKIYQMFLQKGYYGGKRYLSEYVVNQFTTIQFPYNDNRRGLGFDKPLIDNDKKSIDEAYPAIKSSKSSFGHGGFTGTFVWADPESGILFVFMSNRVNPSRKNRKLYDTKLRELIHQAIYDSLINKVNQNQIMN